VTIIGGAEAPLPLSEAASCGPEGIEVEAHEGGQPSWWWLLGAQ